jgi:hypothetical protein
VIILIWFLGVYLYWCYGKQKSKFHLN